MCIAVIKPCIDGQFTCDNQECVDEDNVCDLWPHCQDGSDEQGCGKYPPRHNLNSEPMDSLSVQGSGYTFK